MKVVQIKMDKDLSTKIDGIQIGKVLKGYAFATVHNKFKGGKEIFRGTKAQCNKFVTGLKGVEEI